MIGVDILIMLALLCLCAGGVDRAIGESLAFLQSGGDLDPVHGSGLFIFIPCRASDVSTDNCLDGKNTQLAHLHTPVLQDGTQRLRNLGWEIEGDEMSAQRGNCLCQSLKPCLRAKSEKNTLVGDALFTTSNRSQYVD